MFLALPIFQLVFPGASVGHLVGTIKVGSLTRGLTSVGVTFRHVNLRGHVIDILAPLLLGVAAGAWFISSISQLWVLPAVLLAIAASEYAKRLNAIFSRRLFQISAFAVGLYGGIIGAGVITMIIALLRIKIPEDSAIAQVRIDANAVELIMNIGAIIVAWRVGNLDNFAWVPWALGSAIGGVLGGRLLKKTVTVSRRTQRLLLLCVYGLAAAAALVPWFQLFDGRS